MAILKQEESGMPVTELCRWQAKFDGMDASMIAEMKAMAEENGRLKGMFANMNMQNDLLEEAL